MAKKPREVMKPAHVGQLYSWMERNAETLKGRAYTEVAREFQTVLGGEAVVSAHYVKEHAIALDIPMGASNDPGKGGTKARLNQLEEAVLILSARVTELEEAVTDAVR